MSWEECGEVLRCALSAAPGVYTVGDALVNPVWWASG
jgi:hypothetical protein